MTDPVVSSYPGGDGREIGEAMARGRFAPICDCGRKATHACSYCGGVCGAYVGLFPDKQAAGEALVKHAGYEVLR